MSKYVASKESVDSSLLLWDIRSTQTSIDETYELTVYPSSTYEDTYGSPIDFSIPPQPNGCLIDIDIQTTWCVGRADKVLEDKDEISIINNFSNALWGYVDVQVGNRVNLMQSMEHAYGYQTFFNTMLNSSSDHRDYLYVSECFVLDSGADLADANCLTFFDAAPKNIKNKGAQKRAERIKSSHEFTSKSKLHCPLLNHSKVLPTNMNIKVTLTKNKAAFLLMSAKSIEGQPSVVIKKIVLICTYSHPRDVFLNLMEERLKQSPALYDIEYPEITMRTIPALNKDYSFYDFFHSKLPKAAFFAIVSAATIAGDIEQNPFVFHRMNSFQIYIDNREFFANPIKFINSKTDQLDFSEAYLQLYKVLGLDRRGNCLLTSENFNIYYMIGAVFTDDKKHLNHLNLQKSADVRINLELEVQPTQPMVLVTYALYDKLYSIDSNRQLTVKE